ncbi:TerD family protein [Galactobacter caseinivorans]|uniref:TerD domain-containing protein n=1 Tax=Galactobacter caseinivorans TaxID=2676123 RepID=A0A496PGL2_9MICC|nr:TerD family protein [Galactobacter caseinivorans]RKW69624.1 hypothetical protein DWQ67_12625 [Galactobacter caseinivorans]
MSPLPRGANVSLSRENPQLQTADVTIEWGQVDPAFDSVLAMAAILVGANGKAASQEDLVFFNQLQAPDDAAQWAEMQGGEKVRVQLSRVPDSVERLAMVLYIDALPASVPRTLQNLQTCVVKVSDASTGSTMVTSENMALGFHSETASIVAELYKRKGEWKFRLVGQGYAAGLRGVLEEYGVPR